MAVASRSGWYGPGATVVQCGAINSGHSELGEDRFLPSADTCKEENNGKGERKEMLPHQACRAGGDWQLVSFLIKHGA